MTFDSTINFTLDTICPWTYLAKKRLAKALEQVRAENPDVNFTVVYHPFQLYAEASEQGESKYEWYKNLRYQGSEEQMKKYMYLMSTYGVQEGINFKFGGTVANTLNAHRVIQHYQSVKGPQVADDIIKALYRQYFEEEQHPSSRETLLKACTEAGIPESDAAAFIDDEDEGKQDVKMQILDQAGNGIDSVPTILIEGKRRDFTFTGAKEVPEYVKALEQVVKESK